MKDRESEREVSVQEARDFQKAANIPFFLETSAKTGQNVETVFQMAAKILYENFKDRIGEMVSKNQQLLLILCVLSKSKIRSEGD